MRILLDESLPRTLASHFSGVTVETVFDRAWMGLKNGELLSRASSDFDVFVTADQNLQYQQSLKGHEIGVVVLAGVTNRVIHLSPLLGAAVESARQLEPGEVRVLRGTRG